MSTVKPFITTAGATLAFGIIGTAPANAALLDFNFSTRNGSTGSFTLNTSIPDSDPSSDSGTFTNAVSNFTYSGLRVSVPLDVRASTPLPGPRTVFSIGNTLFISQLNFNNLSLVDRLSDNPSDYSPFFLGDSVGTFAGYGGGFQSLPGGEKNQATGGDLGFFFTPITSVAVVPEGDTVLGSFVGLTFLGMIWLKGRLQRRETT